MFSHNLLFPLSAGPALPLPGQCSADGLSPAKRQYCKNTILCAYSPYPTLFFIEF
ncbi:hypothetical protein HMPREF1146_2097 [Prevotella sp. MSX73]|uniref:Uncharacterized protein n=1 Tax=Segatella buccae ATCC 33574 TaxID=873513 RepID=E6K4C4_9BACT|nr:hypothetical protein HMPREF6485_0497 [Segatella buccae ATCC 33574]EJP31383.1 hypothetical protein HMPREF1146_2097 [Prevotella sp. MSX73]